MSPELRRKVLVIDDEVMITKVICEALENEYLTDYAYDSQMGYQKAIDEKPDVILLDINMPRESGLELCDRLRKNPVTKRIPVMMITGKGDLATLESAFNLGADDFMTKPFDLKELRCRVAAKIRMVAGLMEVEERSSNSGFQCGNLLLHRDRLEVEVENERHSFSVLEFELLAALVKNKDRIMSRIELLSSAWKGVRVSERTVDAHIVSLRKKLQDFDHEIATIYGAGYILRLKTAERLAANA